MHAKNWRSYELLDEEQKLFDSDFVLFFCEWGRLVVK